MIVSSSSSNIQRDMCNHELHLGCNLDLRLLRNDISRYEASKNSNQENYDKTKMPMPNSISLASSRLQELK